MAKLNRRKKDILNALKQLGGRATTREIANRLGGWNVNGVSQTLGVLYDFVKRAEGYS